MRQGYRSVHVGEICVGANGGSHLPLPFGLTSGAGSTGEGERLFMLRSRRACGASADIRIGRISSTKGARIGAVGNGWPVGSSTFGCMQLCAHLWRFPQNAVLAGASVAHVCTGISFPYESLHNYIVSACGDPEPSPPTTTAENQPGVAGPLVARHSSPLPSPPQLGSLTLCFPHGVSPPFQEVGVSQPTQGPPLWPYSNAPDRPGPWQTDASPAAGWSWEYAAREQSA